MASFKGSETATGADLAYINSQLETKANLSLLTGTKVAIGLRSGSVNQGGFATAVGDEAGAENQSAGACAFGNSAAEFNQGLLAIAIGDVAGQRDQGAQSVAIGHRAGFTGLGAHCVALGTRAGSTNQAVRSIVLNATGGDLNNTIEDSIKIAPIRAENVGSHILTYNDTTKEVVKSTIAQVQTAVGGGGGGNQIASYQMRGLTSSQTITTAGYLLFDNVVKSFGTSKFTYSAGTFTSAHNGSLLVSITTVIGISALSSSLRLRIEVSGMTQVVQDTKTTPGTADAHGTYLNVCTDLLLNLGDTVKFYVTANNQTILPTVATLTLTETVLSTN